MNKICNSCKIERSIEQFGILNNSIDGRRPDCKICRKEFGTRNKERLAIKHKEYYENNKERMLEYSKNRYQENKEELNQKNRERYFKNRDRYLEHNRKYKEENRDKILAQKRISDARYREQKRLFGGLITVLPDEHYKICNRCNTLKEIKEFFGVSGTGKNQKSNCGQCLVEIMAEYREKNIDVLKEKYKKYCKENIDVIKARKAKYRSSEAGRAAEKKYRSQPQVRIANCLRARVKTCIKLYRLNKQNKTLNYVGCDTEFLLKYLQDNLRADLTWQMFLDGKLALDHIIPCCSADLTIQENIYKIFHYTNLRLIPDPENASKANEDKKLKFIPIDFNFSEQIDYSLSEAI